MTTQEATLVAINDHVVTTFTLGEAMTTVFLSYSTKDHYFAELARFKLGEKGITLWRDREQLRAGEIGVALSRPVLLNRSQFSSR